jgi:hypothetical protein
MATFDDDDFASVCDAIRRKDSTCAKFVVSHPPPDYGIELGEALMTSQNDSISDLNLRVDLLVDGTATTDNVDRLSRLFDYISTSKSLRRVSLWEAANTRDHYMVARQTGRRIMRAMQDNPNVVEFELESKVPPADFAESPQLIFSYECLRFSRLSTHCSSFWCEPNLACLEDGTRNGRSYRKGGIYLRSTLCASDATGT